MRCPGQDTRYWGEDAIFEVACPRCGNMVEFFKDDASQKCSRCGHRLSNPRMDFGCAAYCIYAEQCLGSLPPEILNKQKEVLKERLRKEVFQFLSPKDKWREIIEKRALIVETLALEEGANLPITIAANFFFEIPEAISLLEGLNLPDSFKEQIREALTKEDSKEFAVLKDAHILTLRSLGYKTSFPIKTKAGKAWARKLELKKYS